MDRERQAMEVDRNYYAFNRMLVGLLADHRDEYALMRNQRIVGFYTKPGDAHRAGLERFADEIFSIQEITDEPIDLGIFSHAGG